MEPFVISSIFSRRLDAVNSSSGALRFGLVFRIQGLALSGPGLVLFPSRTSLLSISSEPVRGLTGIWSSRWLGLLVSCPLVKLVMVSDIEKHPSVCRKDVCVIPYADALAKKLRKDAPQFSRISNVDTSMALEDAVPG